MGPPLKGKKAWRKNIDASEVADFLEEASHQERRGPAVETLQDSELFFVDKAADAEGAHGASGKRKRKQTQLLTRSQVIIEQAHKAKPVTVHKPMRKVNAVKRADSAAPASRQKTPKFSSIPTGSLNIWGADGFAVPSEDEGEVRVKAAKPTKPKLRSLPCKVKAVEIDMAGCSYNPEPEAHQDALAVLVASEMKRMLQRELAPVAPPKLVDLQPGETAGDELARLQVEAEPDDDEDENEIHLSDDDDAPGTTASAKGRKEKKTQQDRNREKRRQSQEKLQESQASLKKQRRDLENLGTLQQQLEEQSEQQELKRTRRQVVKGEKAATLPPKLGKHKYEAASMQVATTDELGGSLRTVKPCPMVALHRFKSLQHRGLIEPRKPVVSRVGKRIEYEKGLRTEKAIAAQAEIEDIKKKRKAVAKIAKKVATGAIDL